MDEEDAVENPSGRGNSRSPAGTKANNGSQALHSLDGETIFAVGEDMDRWSDDDVSPRNSTDRKKLIRKDD